jgi:hypothetical protein
MYLAIVNFPLLSNKNYDRNIVFSFIIFLVFFLSPADDGGIEIENFPLQFDNRQRGTFSNHKNHHHHHRHLFPIQQMQKYYFVSFPNNIDIFTEVLHRGIGVCVWMCVED